ncbi:MAG: UDP-2,3-diacylglucosamine diphosphatase [Gammaproteobacteria bacterium]|nr:UDP-2,3-diacylglucosamine diphosphatase [Gammaproteobacteria bacterium]
MSTLFISDLHLSGERPDIVKLFLDFMSVRAPRSDALYILGDLFEVWLGDDFIPPDAQAVVDALKKYAESGRSLFVMHGNRDFLMGGRFAGLTGCRLLPDPSIIDLYGTKTLIGHGDLLCTDDVAYMRFRQQVRNPQWQQAFLAKPVAERIALAKEAREESKKQTGSLTQDIMDANQHTVEQVMLEHGVTQMIHGHTHRPSIHKFVLDNRERTRIVLGDWYEQGSVLECGKQGCQLQSLPVDSGTGT